MNEASDDKAFYINRVIDITRYSIPRNFSECLLDEAQDRGNLLD